MPILLFLIVSLLVACSEQSIPSAAAKALASRVNKIDKLTVVSGDSVHIEGVNLDRSITASIEGEELPIVVGSAKEATLSIPESSFKGSSTLLFLTAKGVVFASFPVLMNLRVEDMASSALAAEQVCDDIVFKNSAGALTRGLRICNALLKACSSAGEADCRTVLPFLSIDTSDPLLVSANIRNGITIAGISGNYPSVAAPLTGSTLGLADLTLTNFNATVSAAGNFEFWDSAGGRHQVAGDANLTAGKIKSGVSIFGTTGQYPSSSYRLASNTAATDLTLFATQITTNGSFEFFDSAGQVYTGSGDSDLIAANVRSGTAIESLSISGTMPAVLPTAPTPLSTNFLTTPNRIVLTWPNTGAAGYLVVARASAAVTFNPTRATIYSTGAQGSDTILYVGSAATYTHTGVTPGTNYFYAVYSYDANNFYSLAAATATNSAVSCTGLAGGTWVMVPGDAAYGTTDFCVMKYEAKDVSGVATSQAALSPWVNITQTASISACQALGTGYNLISNADWLTLGANIANVASNWSSGTVGTTGGINRGHSDSNPGGACAASTDDSLGWLQSDCTPKNSSGDVWNQKRTHTLSNGSVVWDLSGNVWDWTSYVIPNLSAKPFGSADGSPVSGWREFTTVNSGFTSMTRGELTPTNAQKAFWNDTWASSAYGMGQYYSGTNGSGGALFRGATWAGGSFAGLFAAILFLTPSFVASDLGFRCSFR
ncbi:MAG: hypothetical protein H7318_05470 [Oligoflexus sp.]|nr:hypothetical protein [Oligoflexus sp.]